MDLHNKLKNKKAQKLANASDATGSSMKILKIIMPIIMIGFALSSSASFGIYLIASSLASIAIGEIVSIIINKMTKKQQQQVEEALEKEANRLIKKGKLQEN
jgi:membrane protein insertase Oxa1/YidC/SpoIIIJ